MNQQNDPAFEQYPHGRGYGHDYMRGGEVFGGYGYSTREEYERPLAELHGRPADTSDSGDSPPGQLQA